MAKRQAKVRRHPARELKFTCPHCGSHHLQEIATCAFVTSPVVKVTHRRGDTSVMIDYGKPVMDGDINIERYECGSCNRVLQLKDRTYVDGDDSLKLWFDEQGS